MTYYILIQRGRSSEKQLASEFQLCYIVAQIDMIRPVRVTDAPAIAAIYNEYVLHTTISFETEPLTEEAMRNRIAHYSAQYPYLVDEREGVIVGYCYAHPWKERAAYFRSCACSFHTGRTSADNDNVAWLVDFELLILFTL